MCFEFEAWLRFGFGKGHDHGPSSARSSAKPATPHYYQPPPLPPQTVQRSGNYHYGHQHQGVVADYHATNGGHKAPHHRHHHNHQHPVADEEDRKASNDHRRGHNAHAAAMKSVHGCAGAGAHEKAYVYPAADGTLSKHPATTNAMVVADGAQYDYYQYQERQPVHKQQYYH